MFDFEFLIPDDQSATPQFHTTVSVNCQPGDGHFDIARGPTGQLTIAPVNDEGEVGDPLSPPINSSSGPTNDTVNGGFDFTFTALPAMMNGQLYQLTFVLTLPAAPPAPAQTFSGFVNATYNAAM